MTLHSGLSGPSAHSDVLSATPDNVDSKRALIEEVKRRGRATVASKSYPDADALYGKGIETLQSINADEDDDFSKKDLAVLFSNRSLVRLQMGKVTEALEDADEAVKYDTAYVKAHWRRGQAFTACGHSIDALKSFETALQLEPDNKALKKEVQAAKDRVEQEMEISKISDVGQSGADNDEDNVMKDATDDTTELSKKDAKNKVTSSSKSTKTTDKGEESLFTKSDHVRGYKIRSDGKKTSYFDREISEETKQLIGDIAPKKIDPSASRNDVAPQILPAAEGTSAWNKAGTWEERDVTSWAKDTLEAALLTAEYILPEGSPSPGAHGVVSKISNLDGHASYATVRGKKRYIYEFGFTLGWVLTMGDDHTKACHGTMTFPDIDGTVELGEGYDMTSYCVEGSSPAGTGPLLDRFVRDGGLRDSIHKVIDDWVLLFRATY